MRMFAADLLKSKRILITGGGTGLGRAMAERFLQLGAALYICGAGPMYCNKPAKNSLAARPAKLVVLSAMCATAIPANG